MSLTKTIPKKLRDEMDSDPFYHVCCLQGFGLCDGKIQWHHNFMWKGERSNEPFSILPVCECHHEQEKNKAIGEMLDLIMWSRATLMQRKLYSKAVNVEHYYGYLKKKYGHFYSNHNKG